MCAPSSTPLEAIDSVGGVQQSMQWEHVAKLPKVQDPTAQKGPDSLHARKKRTTKVLCHVGRQTQAKGLSIVEIGQC